MGDAGFYQQTRFAAADRGGGLAGIPRLWRRTADRGAACSDRGIAASAASHRVICADQSLALHTASPLSNTMRHTLSASSRQMELKRLTILPSSYTGPVLSARLPEARTST